MGLSAPAKRPSNVDVEAEGQKEAVRVESKRSKGQRGLKSELKGPKLARSEPELKDK